MTAQRPFNSWGTHPRAAAGPGSYQLTPATFFRGCLWPLGAPPEIPARCGLGRTGFYRHPTTRAPVELPAPGSLGRTANMTHVTPHDTVTCMATLKGSCRCKSGPKSVEFELINREIIWVGLLRRVLYGGLQFCLSQETLFPPTSKKQATRVQTSGRKRSLPPTTGAWKGQQASADNLDRGSAGPRGGPGRPCQAPGPRKPREDRRVLDLCVAACPRKLQRAPPRPACGRVSSAAGLILLAPHRAG